MVGTCRIKIENQNICYCHYYTHYNIIKFYDEFANKNMFVDNVF